MPLVKFVAVEDPTDGTTVARVDDVELRLGGEAEKVTDKQLKSLKELPGLNFEVGGKGKKSSSKAKVAKASAETPEPPADPGA